MSKQFGEEPAMLRITGHSHFALIVADLAASACGRPAAARRRRIAGL